MGFFDGYNISTSGMNAQRERINIVSANLANAQTTSTIGGGPYKKQNIVFEELLMHEKERSNAIKNHNNIEQTTLRGVGVKTITESLDNPVMRYEPSHPDANEKGYVAYPNINPVVEMTDLIEALRTYESNIAAFQTHKNMDNKTLEILKQ
ncbi:MAG: flagellar basal body rod protein FlgC [Arcobacteraceae bacterium]|jgi:flagellar basal-body rod protein FlgC|nr:flagellar basal body rod protein FlgC [Arcobacteraceae bacterium]MDY0365560.1 flagellar basal body rod protein FlgC [Arcobacteraceae bacterium]